uniref:Uncharacterized protein n=1 Tax=Rattus norvegicus TaxID=10116 RepID=A0A8I5Y965_RAT
MAPQHLPSTRMAPQGMLLGLLLASCLTFCLSCQNSASYGRVYQFSLPEGGP